MTVGMLTVALSAGLIALAVFGPALLRHAAPALVRVPRLAIVVVAGGIGVWLVTLLAIGPVLAWAGAGPALLPERAAEVCQRCLSAANPFAADTTDTLVPAVLLLALPVALALALGAGLARQMSRRSSRSRHAARTLLHGARRQLLHGHEVALVDAEHPFALTFPARHGGIVLSTGAVRALEPGELAAVLAHEHAHLHQRHHLITALVDSIAAYLRWVPLIRAAALPGDRRGRPGPPSRRNPGAGQRPGQARRTHPPRHAAALLPGRPPRRRSRTHPPPRPPQRRAGRRPARRRDRRISGRHGRPCRRRPPALRLGRPHRLRHLTPPEQERTTKPMDENPREVILHVADDPADVQRALDAAAGLHAAGLGVRVRVVVNGPALAGLTGTDAVQVPEHTEVAACSVGLGRRGIDPGELRPEVGTVPSAVTAIVHAQLAGAAYIRI